VLLGQRAGNQGGETGNGAQWYWSADTHIAVQIQAEVSVPARIEPLATVAYPPGDEVTIALRGADDASYVEKGNVSGN
jgi:hypothetical protein